MLERYLSALQVEEWDSNPEGRDVASSSSNLAPVAPVAVDIPLDLGPVATIPRTIAVDTSDIDLIQFTPSADLNALDHFLASIPVATSSSASMPLEQASLGDLAANPTTPVVGAAPVALVDPTPIAAVDTPKLTAPVLAPIDPIVAAMEQQVVALVATPAPAAPTSPPPAGDWHDPSAVPPETERQRRETFRELGMIYGKMEDMPATYPHWPKMDYFDLDLPVFDVVVGRMIPPIFRSNSCWQARVEWACHDSVASTMVLRKVPSVPFRGHNERWLFELSPTIHGKSVQEGDWLYIRADLEKGGVEGVYAGGGYYPGLVSHLQTDRGSFWVKTWTWIRMEGVPYILGELACLQADGFFGNVFSAMGWAHGNVEEVSWRLRPNKMPQLEDLSHIPGVEARIRIMYQLLRQHLPDELKGICSDARNAHILAAQNEVVAEPSEVIEQLRLTSARIKQRHGDEPGFAGPTAPKGCVNCGVAPPETKYRWPRRICDKCRPLLQRLGYSRYLGYQVQENLEVGKCYPGIVYVKPEEYPGPPSKLKDFIPGNLKLDWAQVDNMGWGDRPIPTRALPVTPDILPLLIGRQPQQRYSHALGGIGVSGCRPMVSAMTAHNRAKALMIRVFRELPERAWGRGPKPGTWDFAAGFVDELLPDFVAEPMEIWDWWLTMPAHRRRDLSKAIKEYEEKGWKKGYGRFSAFVKAELLPAFAKSKGLVQEGLDLDMSIQATLENMCGLGNLVPLTEMSDRLIQAPHNVAHVVAGPILKPYVYTLKERWKEDVDSYIFYASCKPERLQSWLRILDDGDGWFFWMDFSMFDRTHSDASWRFMESLYGWHGEIFAEVMKAWRAPRGTCGPFIYKGPVMNASGRDDTALANAVLNGFATYLSVTAAWFSISVRNVTVAHIRAMRAIFRLGVCGDDSLAKLPRVDAARQAQLRAAIAANLAEFGFEAKICSSEDILDVVFLGMRPYCTRSGKLWGRTIGRAAYKFGWCIKAEERDVMAWVTGVADAVVHTCTHVPVLYDMARRVSQLRDGAKRTEHHADPNKPWQEISGDGVPYDDLTLEGVARAYSRHSTPGFEVSAARMVTVKDLWGLIGEIRTIERIPCVIDHWLLRHMVAFDEL